MSTSHNSPIALKITRLRFFSEGDETAFFGWLKNLNFVESVQGREDNIFVEVDHSAVDEESLRELLAIFHRYCIDMRQLIVFDSDEFSDWFRRTDAYWYKAVFETTKQNEK